MGMEGSVWVSEILSRQILTGPDDRLSLIRKYLTHFIPSNQSQVYTIVQKRFLQVK